ncbi:MAG: exopolysaccharide biosynthesis polyprenyl glycosylphosphotransferase [Alphaproteobacteria bacterium]|nr:exopolysaccharide biosynthesis polyprenyl glycosylphosphotransferase [Alphaproteobacteria bacterium]
MSKVLGTPFISWIKAITIKKNLSRLGYLASDVFAFSVVYKLIRSKFFIGNIFIYKADLSGHTNAIQTSIEWFPLIVLFLIASFAINGHYNSRKIFWDDLRSVLGFSIVALIIDSVLFAVSGNAATVQVLPLFWGGMVAGVMAMRQIIKAVMSAAGMWDLPVVLVGSGENAEQTLRALHYDHGVGFDITRAVCLAGSPVSEEFKLLLEQMNIPMEVLPHESIVQLAEQGLHLILAPEEDEVRSLRTVVDRLSLTPSRFDIVPPLRGLPLYGLDVTHIFGSEILMLRPRNNLARWAPRVVKTIVDYVLALILVVLLSPVMGWISFLLWRTGARPLYRQDRIGRNGKLFRVFKFQTMVPNAEQVLEELLARDPEIRKEWETNFKLRDDPRVTPLGRFLRRSSMDELPQLFNVLKGEMSLTGPRPLALYDGPYYGDLHFYYQVAPGITGLWQISGRNDIEHSRREFLDTWYVKNWSLWYDFVILLKTVKVVLARSGAY